ncbi:plectin [Actinomadura sp. DC4]|uniref:plectin n=1 Tax=Actinomadura sp. DC4 TaxID=3055069 RepID=UPI0025B1529A|nr:plectin [Actinomadura sp. DC4]MDN3359464.1 plectin [Actinomadura sp. DC4]
MSLGRKTSPEVAERYAADKELAAGLSDRLDGAQEAEARLRSAQAERRPSGEVRPLAIGFERALYDAIAAADAAERVAMGTKTYEHGDAKQRRAAQIAARRARAKPSVRPYTDEVDRLRTLRETHKLTFRTSPSVAS